MAEEREVPVGEPAQQVRDVVRAGDARRPRAVGVEQAVGEQPVGERAGLAGHRRGVADDLADVVQHPRHVRVAARRGPAPPRSTWIHDSAIAPGGGAAGSASGSTACSSPSGARSTTTMGWITRRASPPARRIAARTDSTR